MKKSIKSRAAVLFDMGLPRPFSKSKPIKVIDIDVDPPGFDEVLVKVSAAGLCHSDLSVVNGNRPRAMPMVLGHEGSGVVAAIGEGVENFKIGDHVVFVFVPSCGKCIPCKEGRPALCDPGLAAGGAGTLLSGEKRFRLNGDFINHQVGVSCFSEFTVVSSKSLVKVDQSLPLDEAALFGCAVITGAGAGIGRATALALLNAGYAVALAGRNIETLQATEELAGHNRSNALSIVTDISDPSSILNLFSEVKNQFGRLDLLFNNAGIGAGNSLLEELPIDQWKQVVDINLTGSFICTQEAFKIMKEQDPMGGRIINNGSISADRPRPNSAPYTATKHALTGLTKSTSLDGRKYNIACGQIDIGNASTDMTARMSQGVPQPNGTVIPEPRMPVESVSEAVLYMANLPLEANVLFMTVMATQMPYIGRG